MDFLCTLVRIAIFSTINNRLGFCKFMTDGGDIEVGENLGIYKKIVDSNRFYKLYQLFFITFFKQN